MRSRTCGIALLVMSLFVVVLLQNSSEEAELIDEFPHSTAEKSNAVVEGVSSTSANSTVKTWSVRDGQFVIYHNSTYRVPFVVSRLEEDPQTRKQVFAFPNFIKHAVVEVGTNDEPELTSLVLSSKATLLIAFEPQPIPFQAMRNRFPSQAQLLPIPAAVSPHSTFLSMYVSGHKGCTSILPMSNRVRRFADTEGRKANKKGSRIQLRTVKFCATNEQRIEVPALPLSAVLSRVPSRVSIDLIVTDAQGFDTFVASTIGRPIAEKVPFLLVECQDLNPGHTLFLVENAPNCAELRSCVEQWYPHRLAYCWDNAPKVRELNCLFQNVRFPNATLPSKIKIFGGHKQLVYEQTRKNFVCPTVDAE